ncbi:MAG: TonB family protein [Alteromonadaceae bacterium]|nr:TonB family protein [Alteromonadaceae bacterium]
MKRLLLSVLTGFITCSPHSVLANYEQNAATAYADEPIKLEVMERATPLERVSPTYPVSAARRGKEGWVQVSFVVDEEGNVVDPVIHDSSGVHGFEKASLNAVKKWKYTPAMVDGEPVEQCHSRVKLSFKMRDSKASVTRKFKSKYKEASKLISAKDFDAATTIIEELEQREQYNFTESNYLWVLQALLAEGQQDNEKMLSALARIKFSGKGYLNDTLYMSMMQKLFVTNLKTNRLAYATEAYNVIKEHAPDSDVAVKLAPYQKKIEDYIASGNPLVISGNIDDGKSWSHKLVRSEFELVSEKPLDRVEIRCDNKRSTYNSVMGNTFTIPEKWGQCMVYVNSDPGVSFTLSELSRS